MTHICHWPGCTTPVPPKLWGCRKHWFTLPKSIRSKIWATYTPGQEITKTPSQKYLEVAHEAKKWAIEYEEKVRLQKRASSSS